MAATMRTLGRGVAALLLAWALCPSCSSDDAVGAGPGDAGDAGAAGGASSASDATASGAAGMGMGGSAPDAAPLGPLPACAWSPELYQVDGAVVACTPARRLISCSSASGDSAVGLSDGTTLGGVDTSALHCKDECREGEYAIQCGSLLPDAATQEPPAGCRSSLATPGGTFFMCCPCE